MYLALIVLPILGSIVSGFFGRKVGVSGSQLITCTCVVITTFLAIIAFISFLFLVFSELLLYHSRRKFPVKVFK